MNQISALFQQGNLDAARKLCRSLVNKHPNDDKVRYAHAMICQQAGDIDAAIAAYETTVKISPSHLQALANLGGLLVSAGRHDEAVAPLTRALRFAPNSAPARYNLAQAYHAQGNLPAALQEAHKARALDDKIPDIYSFIGLVSEDMLKHAEAADAYRRLASLVAEKRGPWVMQASNLQLCGKFDEAEELLETALKHYPDHPEIHNQLSLGKRSAEREAVSISVLRKKVQEMKLEDLDQVKYLFTLGDLLDRAGDFENAIKYYNEGNRFKKSYEGYEISKYERLTEGVVSVFTPSFYEAKADYGHSSDRPVFVVGMPRSGTTLLERLLSSHPDVAGVGELGFFSARCQEETFGPSASDISAQEFGAFSADKVSEYANRFLKFLPENASEVAHAVDSTPGNIAQVGHIKLAFPNAHIIHSQRNPLDTALSVYFRNFVENSVLYANSMSDIVTVFHCHARLMKHYEEVLGMNIQKARYEKTVANTPGEISRLLSPIVEDVSAASFDNTASEDSIMTASVWQARQPVYKTSIEKWRNYEKHIGPLIDGLADFQY
ncbi:MAG: tetratricopeptide repeat protein [Alphaproteobacteria bacterium]|nr:tetratricopeptide repeat protein [Alphaproteobacteria bacterium]